MQRLSEERIVARYIAEPIARKKGRALADPVAEELGKGVTLVGLARARSPVNLDQSPSGGWLPAKAAFPVGLMIPALLLSTAKPAPGPPRGSEEKPRLREERRKTSPGTGPVRTADAEKLTNS